MPKTDFSADVRLIGSIAAIPSILEVVCRTTGMGFAAVARVTENRWIACAVRDTIEFGLKPGGELNVETTICNEIRDSRQAVFIDHVATDEAYSGHPTPAMYNFLSYASVPIVLPDGRFFGTLCAIDRNPAHVTTAAVTGMFRLFAELILIHVVSQEKLTTTSNELAEARETANLREQFIAVLGHDLRNPLASIGAGINLLSRAPLEQKSITIVTHMRGSLGRMYAMIDNLLDFARGRLDGGLMLARQPAELKGTLESVVEELRASHVARTIMTKFELDRPVDCDQGRLAQMLSNLLANALTHGAPDRPVRVDAVITHDRLRLAVANEGTQIPAETLARIFEPYERARSTPGAQGLGLGLFIAAEIARAHAGTLTATSTSDVTTFTFEMPMQAG